MMILISSVIWSKIGIFKIMKIIKHPTELRNIVLYVMLQNSDILRTTYMS